MAAFGVVNLSSIIPDPPQNLLINPDFYCGSLWG
jgi:hypothetical protein